ncbi:MAG: wax ester/triacylglycerol synthase domain-containing protein [Tetrasphaera sp.]
MQKLTTLDRMFSSLDSETTNGVLGGLVLYDPPQDGRRAADAGFMRERIAERIDYLPPLYREVKKAPLRMDHDWLGRAKRVDLTKHVRTLTLPAPGTHDQLAREVSRLMSTDLDMSGPPWDYIVIEGLEDGSVAHLLRVHHLVVDGGSMPRLWDALQDEPTMPLVKEDEPGFPEPRFGTPEMLVREAVGVAKRPVDWTLFSAKMAGWMVKAVKEQGVVGALLGPTRIMLPGKAAKPIQAAFNPMLRKRGTPEIVPYVPRLVAPKTPFNRRVTAQRTFVFADLPLADFKDSGKLIGASINDMVLGVCAGALRRYMTQRGISTDEPLIVCVPVSIRQPDEKIQWANFVHMIFAPFPVDIENPVERVRKSSEAVKLSKGSFDAMPTVHLREMFKFIPPPTFNLMVKAFVKLPGNWSRGTWNVVVSNVKGPSKPNHVDGLRVKGYWPASFLSIGGGINITLQSYTDRICFGIVGAPEQAGDLQPLVDALGEVLAETVAAVKASAPTPLVPRRETERTTPAPRARRPRATSQRARRTSS